MDMALNSYEEEEYCLPKQYSLQAASGGPGLLKKAGRILQKGLERLLESDRGEESLQYGVTKGNYKIRQELASFLTRQYGQPVDKDDLVISYGASLAVDMMMQMFHPEQPLFIEDPTYYVMANYGSRKNNPIAIPLEKDGMDLDMLEEKLKQIPADIPVRTPPYKAVAYIMVSHQNPSGVSYSPEKRERLAELARKYNMLVICDDVYHTLSFESDPKKARYPVQRLFAYDRKDDPDYKGNVVSVGSFSKNLAPGLRFGWIEAPKVFADAFVDTYAVVGGCGMCPFVGGILTELMKTDLIDDHVDFLRRNHKERCLKFMEVFETKLAKYGVTFHRPSGGCFLWLELPQDVSADDVLVEARTKEKVTFLPGERCSLSSNHKNCMRLSFAFYELPDLVRGAEGLSRAIENVIKQQK